MNDLTTSFLLICAATTFAAALVVAQRRFVANVSRRFVKLPRFEQTLLVVAVCVMTVCAQKSGTNEVTGVAGNVFSAEEGEAQSRGEEGDGLIQGGSGVSPLQQKEISILSRSGETPLPLSTTTSASPSLSNLSVENFQETNVFAITSFSLDCAGCSVLNIAGHRVKSFGMMTRLKRWYRNQQDRSVGTLWEGVGELIFLGYCYKAPLDGQGADLIAGAFTSEVKGGSDFVQAWKNANDRNVGRNACALDCSKTPHEFWYWNEQSGTSVWTKVTKGANSW